MATEMDYRNPTLTEILAELHLEENTLPEKGLMALAREFAASGFDDQEFMQTVIESQDKTQELEPKIVPRIRCWDRERIRLVQFSPDAVFVNLIGEYPRWDKFSEHIQTTRNAITDALKKKIQPARIEFTTINKWKVNFASFTIGQYLNCGGLFIPAWYSEVSVSSDISLGQGFHYKDGFNKRVKIKVRTSDDDVQFQILITSVVADQQRDFDVLMNQLHNESAQFFEEIITDKVRNEVMGGKQ